jgi:UDP:flavonoid glycosyltransferase YjiC (YdhE family)
MANIAIAVFGTGGDVFPCIAVAQRLQARGHVVSFVTQRWLGLYPRLAGFRVAMVGDGSEKLALSDSQLLTTRFEGMDSWRRSMTQYAFPFLAGHYDDLREIIGKLQPDVVVTTAQAYWGALAASELGINWTSLHLYPQLLGYEARSRSSSVSRFGGRMAKWLNEQERRLTMPQSSQPVLWWGRGHHITLVGHDPIVDQSAHKYGVPVGYPYSDAAYAGNDVDTAVALEFLSASTGAPKVIATLGSFIGFSQEGFWHGMATMAKARGWHLLLLGSNGQDFDAGPNVLGIGHAPLSRLIGNADMMIHHGGIGTMYAALNAGIPAVVVPHAFDQTYNARLAEALGVGLIVDRGDLGGIGNAIDVIHENTEVRTRASELAKQLIPPESAAEKAAMHILNQIQ